ncbi:MAG: hypothetical protein ACLTZT_03810 [Butyricimonas faecalis]
MGWHGDGCGNIIVEPGDGFVICGCFGLEDGSNVSKEEMINGKRMCYSWGRMLVFIRSTRVSLSVMDENMYELRDCPFGYGVLTFG